LVHNEGMNPLDLLARAIAEFEGFYRAGSRAQRNNNPGNLKYRGQRGAVGADRQGYAIFSSVEAGWEALRRQIELDARRGLTLEQFINKYAPPSENPTSNYLRYVVARTGLSPQSPLPFVPAGLPSPVPGGPANSDGWCSEGDCWWWMQPVPRLDYTLPVALVVGGVALVALVS